MNYQKYTTSRTSSPDLIINGTPSIKNLIVRGSLSKEKNSVGCNDEFVH